jgi:outer membrane protein assembly factor BamB
MTKMVRLRIVLVFGILALWITQNSVAGKISSKPLISQELLKHAKLKMLWDNELPIKKNENLERLFLLDNRLYAVSDRNFVLYLNQKNGKIIFGKNIEPAGLPIMELKLYDNELMYLSSNSKLVQLNAQSGVVLNTTDIGFSLTCPVARNSSYFYLAGTDNRLHVIHADNKVQVFEVAAENESMITSVTADEISVIFATAEGNIICITPNLPQRLWQFDASKAIAGEVITDGMSLFFASRDTNVYRVDMVGLPQKKQLIWKHQTAAVLEDAPLVTQEIVYQHVKGKGLTALNKNTGSALWQVPGGIDLLTEAGNKAYIITDTGTLVVMDNIKAKKLYSVNLVGVTKHTSNLTDDKIYFADNLGRIACLQPVE